MTGVLENVLRRQDSAGRGAGAWFALLDAAQDERAAERWAAAGARSECLYAGWLARLAASVGPHLAAVRSVASLPPWFSGEWRRNGVVLLQSRASFDDVRRHFRGLLMVKDEAGTKYRFRFYDPRVLRAFLPACTPAEVESFFGPVERFYAPARDGDGVLCFSRQDGVLRVAALSAARAAS